MSTGRILVVDDENDIRATISDILTDEGYRVRVAADAAAARAEVSRERPDLVLLDVWMPDVDGISLLKEWSDQGVLRCPVVMLSGHGTVETAVEATRLGAVDFVEKPLSLAKLLRTVQKALERRADGRRPGPRSLLPAGLAPGGRSPAMQALREQALAMSRRPEPVLILGEAGSGRALLARHIHDLGGSTRPFVSLAGGAVPDENASAVLLGLGGPGGVTPGVLERAAGGTLFIGDLQDLGPVAGQLLAGVLDQGSFTRVGEAAPRPLDLRLLASLQTGGRRSRPELLDRVGVLELRVPPLRERQDDVPDLLRATVDRLVEEEDMGFRRFGAAAQNRLRNYPWPGNIRELESLVRRLLLAGGPEEIPVAELEAHLRPAAGTHEPLVKQDLLALPLREAREQFERAYLTEQLALCGGRVGQLAKRVGMERTHLYRKLRTLGVDFRQAAEDD